MITIVTDSTAYFTKSEAVALGIKVVPVSYSVNGYKYHETYADRNGKFTGLISQPGAVLKTFHTSSTTFKATFKELVDSGKTVLCITMSSRLSGEYNSALAAAKDIGSSKIKVIDSLLTGGGLYILVRKAKEFAESGMTVDKIIERLYDIRNKIYICFSVDDMQPLRSSHRLSLVRQNIGTSLYRKPLFKVEEGAISSDGMARSDGHLLSRLIGRIPPNASKIIIHCARPSRIADTLYRSVHKLYPRTSLEMRPLGPVLAIHLGLSVVGVVFHV